MDLETKSKIYKEANNQSLHNLIETAQKMICSELIDRAIERNGIKSEYLLNKMERLNKLK